MSNNKKPREFNVQVKHGKVISGSGVYMDAENVHVIEHSAYAALQKENEELKKEKGHFRDLPAAMEQIEVNMKLTEENASLRESLKERDDFIEVRGKHVSQLADERDSLIESLKEAYEALDLAMTVWQTDWKCATCVEVNEACYYKLSNALAKIKAKHGEL